MWLWRTQKRTGLCLKLANCFASVSTLQWCRCLILINLLYLFFTFPCGCKSSSSCFYLFDAHKSVLALYLFPSSPQFSLKVITPYKFQQYLVCVFKMSQACVYVCVFIETAFNFYVGLSRIVILSILVSPIHRVWYVSIISCVLSDL